MENNIIEESGMLDNIWQAAVYLSLALFLVWFGKLLFTTFKKGINLKTELLEEDNLAFAVAIVGYFIGIIICLSSSIIGVSNGFFPDATALLIYGLLSIVLLTISAGINDKITFRKFSMIKELIDDKNVGSGVIMAANYIASALIIFGAISGEGKNFFPEMSYGFLLSGIITSVVFWGLGQALIVIFTAVYDKMIPYDLHDEIEKDNVAVSFAYAGMLISLGIIIYNGVSGDFVSWSDHLTWLAIESAIGIALLPVIRWTTDKLLFPSHSITDELVNQEKANIGIGIIEGFAYMAGAYLIVISI
jgi:uncharacterized membrane protein YjfL (UPF0719 family)